MDKYAKLLAALSVVMSILIVSGDLAYAKYRTSSNRLPSNVQAM